MALKMQQSYHHSVAVKVNDQQMGTKRGYTFIQANRTWLPKVLLLWVMAMALFSLTIYNGMDADNRVRRKEVLGSMCDQRARMLQDQFSVSVNHVHALAILVSTFHYYKNPSAIDQVLAPFSRNLDFCFCWLDFKGSKCLLGKRQKLKKGR
jgi:histidine kinase 2/3/4 (cytokinin receptor)